MNINDENIRRSKRIKQRSMDLETEIPIWYDGRVKWISNLTSRSTCSDVIQAILSSTLTDSRLSEINENYILYESWRGVERPLKTRCRLLKLWNSWAGESQNVTLTLRSREEQSTPTHLIIRQQDKKLNKIKRKIKKTNKQIEKFNFQNKVETENDLINKNSNLLTYLNIYRSIIDLNTEIDSKQKLILRLTSQIENEKQQKHFIQDDFNQLLADVNQTLTYSRLLTEQSDKLDQQINQTNQNIETKLILLDELELDWALNENIDIDSLDDQDDEQHIFPKHISPSPPPILPVKTLTGQTRPTAIVEPSLSTSLNTNKSKGCLSINKTSPLSLNNLHLDEKSFLLKNPIHIIPFPIRYNYRFESSTNDESDTGISSTHSNDEQLVTLV